MIPLIDNILNDTLQSLSALSFWDQQTSTSQHKIPGYRFEKKMSFIYTEIKLIAGNQKDTSFAPNINNRWRV